jgi:hypothetical protein
MKISKNYNLFKEVKEEVETLDLSHIEEKEVAKIIKKHLTQKFPFVKFSCTTRRIYGISLNIISSPFGIKSKYISAIHKYCNDYITSIKTYFNHYNYCTMDCSYKSTDINKEILDIINQYNIDEKRYKEELEKKRQIELEEFLRNEKERKIEFEKQEKIEKEQEEYIYKNVEITELEKNDNYLITNILMANLNKNCTIEEYEEEINNGNYCLKDIKIHRELKFLDKKSFDYFSNLLLNNFTFLKNSGGSYDISGKINSQEEYLNLTKEEISKMKFNLIGIAVFYDNKLQYIIDTQGYNYCRYVGLLNAETKNKDTLKDNKKLLYNLIDNSNEKIEELKLNLTNFYKDSKYLEWFFDYIKKYDSESINYIIDNISIEYRSLILLLQLELLNK